MHATCANMLQMDAWSHGEIYNQMSQIKTLKLVKKRKKEGGLYGIVVIQNVIKTG